jgi:hypothetical protein
LNNNDHIDDFGSSDESSHDNDDTVPEGLLNKIRALICTICASGQRQDDLTRVILTGNTLSWWKGEGSVIVKIPENKLLLDVHTHWDSMFMMLMHLHKLKQVHPLFPLRTRANFNVSNQPMINFCQTQGKEYRKIQDLALSPSE